MTSLIIYKLESEQSAIQGCPTLRNCTSEHMFSGENMHVLHDVPSMIRISVYYTLNLKRMYTDGSFKGCPNMIEMAPLLSRAGINVILEHNIVSSYCKA